MASSKITAICIFDREYVNDTLRHTGQSFLIQLLKKRLKTQFFASFLLKLVLSTDFVPFSFWQSFTALTQVHRPQGDQILSTTFACSVASVSVSSFIRLVPMTTTILHLCYMLFTLMCLSGRLYSIYINEILSTKREVSSFPHHTYLNGFIFLLAWSGVLILSVVISGSRLLLIFSGFRMMLLDSCLIQLQCLESHLSDLSTNFRAPSEWALYKFVISLMRWSDELRSALLFSNFLKTRLEKFAKTLHAFL